MARPRPPAREAPWGWALAGLLAGTLAALLLFAPARWLAAGVTRASQGHVVLQEARGTVWDGSARLVLTGGAGSKDAATLPGRVQWRLLPRWNGVRVVLRADCCTDTPVAVRARLRWGGVDIDVGDSVSQWPASVARGLGTPWNTMQLTGDLRLATRDLSVEWTEGRPVVSGRAELEALRIASRLSTLRPMGSYRIILQGGTPTTLRLETLDGALRLSGSGQWVGSRLRFRGEASAAPERETALGNLLNIIGRRSGARSVITIG